MLKVPKTLILNTLVKLCSFNYMCGFEDITFPTDKIPAQFINTSILPNLDIP